MSVGGRHQSLFRCRSQVFLYMAEHWDANPNSDRNTYVSGVWWLRQAIDMVTETTRRTVVVGITRGHTDILYFEPQHIINSIVNAKVRI